MHGQTIDNGESMARLAHAVKNAYIIDSIYLLIYYDYFNNSPKAKHVCCERLITIKLFLLMPIILINAYYSYQCLLFLLMPSTFHNGLLEYYKRKTCHHKYYEDLDILLLRLIES